MASVTVALTGYETFTSLTGNGIRWDDNVSLGVTFALGETQTLTSINMRDSGSLSGQINISIIGANNRFTADFEATGRIIFTASDGETLEVMIANADMTEAYTWTPTNATEVATFGTHVRGLTDHNATLTLTDDPPPPPLAAPAYADNTGDAQSWTVGTAITPITVPAASGNPTPTYTTFGIPAGVSFNTATRAISGTPSVAGSGTLRVRATNSQGLADWTAPYTTAADTSAPSFADSTGDAQAWTQNQQITPITVPEATGSPAPTYAVVGTPPAGIVFNTGTRAISGTPSVVGSGTITIRATNSEGSDDWTVAYATTAFVSSGSANYDSIAMLPGAYAIRFTASGNYADYFESSPAEGMLLNNIPAGMFTDTALYWIERFRGADGGNSLAADNGQFYTATRFEFHRGGSSIQQRDFLPVLSDDYSWVVINETTEEYLMWPANGQSAGSGSSGGSFGGGFCVYVIIPTHITDTNSLNENNVKAFAQAFDGTNPLNSAGQFNDSLLNSEVIVALIPNNTFRPTFAPPPAQIQATTASGAPTAIAQVRTVLEERIQAATASGAPVAAARIRTTPPMQQIAASASSGAPVAAAQIRTTPPPQQIQASAASGAPAVAARVRITPPQQPMLEQTVNLGVVTGHQWSGSIAINFALIEGGVAANLVAVNWSGGTSAALALSFTTGVFDVGPDFIAAVETRPDAFVFTSSNGTSFTLAGPNAPGVTTADPTEPYIWMPANNAEWLAWWNTAQGTTLTLRINGTPPPIAEQIQATTASGVPSATARVRTAPGPQQIRASASSGAPSATARIRTQYMAQVRSATATGAPIAAARIRATLPGAAQIMASAASGVPIAAAQVRAVTQPTINAIAAQSGEVVRALVTADEGVRYYDHRGGSSFGSVSSDSDLAITDNAAIVYIGRVAGGADLRINREGTDSLATLFGSGGAGENAEVHIATPYGNVILGSDDVAATSDSVVRWDLTAAQQTLLGMMQPGDMLNFVVARFALAIQIQASASTGAPVAAARVRLVLPGAATIAASTSSGAPIVAARVRTQYMAQVRAAVLSGIPVVSARVRTALPTAAQVMAATASGAPIATAAVRVSLPGPAQVQTSVSSGVPSALARVRLILPNAGQIRASISTGVPVVDARVGIITPNAGQIRAEAVSGIPAAYATVRAATTGEQLGLVQSVTYQTSRIDLFCRRWLGSDDDATRRRFIRYNYDWFRSSPTFWLPVGRGFWIDTPRV